MFNRKSLLVGSIPAGTTQEAVKLAFDELGPDLIAVPDGETGDRRAWVAAIIDRLNGNPALYLKKPGRWTTYEDIPAYRVRRGMRIDPASLELGYLRAYQDSRPVMAAAAAQCGIASPPLQVGVASAFDLALFPLGLLGTLRHRAAFNAAATREVAAICAEANNDVIFQIEVPAELVTVARAPRALRRVVAEWMGRVSVELAASASPGTRFGIHLCYGDLGNHSLVTGLRNCGAAVALANSIVSRWPADVKLEYIHIPFAAGDEPPQLAESYYAPLGGLRLPAQTRMVAGFVHEALPEQQLRHVLGMIEEAWGRQVDVAAACGLGRRAPSVARAIMHQSKILCEAPASL